MSKSHPNDGPTFSKATIRMPRLAAPSPERSQVQLEGTMRDAAKIRNFRQQVSKVGFLEALGLNRSKKPSDGGQQ
jgi:hypothetical protein